ncbi:MAG: Mth938-like domain-containing protein [Alphaproteobacteria bacterium]|nr:Mth938-like domain-containing protein [Alphaproteobacteria bacterium]
MRDIMPPTAAHLLKVDSYGDQGFSINGVMHVDSLLLFPERVVVWEKLAIPAWTIEDFSEVLSTIPPIEVLLLGTGKTHQFVHPDLKKAFKAKGIGVDSMDTGAACRTYNILLSESRRVAAILLKAL